MPTDQLISLVNLFLFLSNFLSFFLSIYLVYVTNAGTVAGDKFEKHEIGKLVS